MSTHWAAGLGSAVILSLIGVILGLLLGASKFDRQAVSWFTFGYSIAFIILLLGWFLYPGVSWRQGTADIAYRLIHSFGLFLARLPVEDTLLFVVFMVLVLWSAGMMAGFALTRFGSFVGAAVPAGVILVIIQLYAEGKSGNETLLAVYIMLSLFLLGRLSYVQKRKFWVEQRIKLLYEARTDLHVTIVLAAVSVVILVWMIPTSRESFVKIKDTWERLTRPIQNMQDNLGNAVAGLQVEPLELPGEYYGDTLDLGGQAASGDSVFFQIQVPPADSSGSVRYYWRVRSYNVFKDDQWYSENVSAMPFDPGEEPAIPLADPQGTIGDFNITVASAASGTLITPARPVWISTPAQLVFQPVPDGKVDPIQFRSNTPLLTNDEYSVHARQYQPTVAQLRAAGDVYPDWVTSYYLQLPENLSPDYRSLTNRVTAPYENAYDRANAITQYLRSTIRYTPSVLNPPAGQDPLHWFLFNSQQGFCNYFATAEVIMLRDAGIPSRLVVGFAQGEQVAPNIFNVRRQDSHAWPEVYFPGVGWVEFEPTANQAALVRPAGVSVSPSEPGGTPTAGEAGSALNPLSEDPAPVFLPETSTSGDTGANRFIQILLVGALIIALLRQAPVIAFIRSLTLDVGGRRWSLPVVLKKFYQDRAFRVPDWLHHWAAVAELDPIERTFAGVYRTLHALGEKPKSAQTPEEAAALLTQYLPRVSREIGILLVEYEHHIYGKRWGYYRLAKQAIWVVRKEAWRVILQRRIRQFNVIFRAGP